MKLYLVRHGIASDQIGGTVRNDFQRPLTEEGKREVEAVALGLRNLGISPAVVLHSPLVRACQTAEIISGVLSAADGLRVVDALSPAGKVTDIYKALKDYERAEEVFMVGHEPDVGRLVATLLWAGPELELPFQKAAVCRVDVTSVPPNEPGTLAWFMPPKISRLLSQATESAAR
jgi:phosphohistidine phosphatase